MATAPTNGKKTSRPFSELTARSGTPTPALFGRLPLLRWLPQNAHALCDALAAAAVLTSATFAKDSRARAAALGFGCVGFSSTALTFYRMGGARLIPIEAHQAFDHLFGLALLSAPFVLRYSRKDPVASAVHLASGILTVVAALLTDYRMREPRGA